MVFFGSLDDFSTKTIEIKDRIKAEFDEFSTDTVSFYFPSQGVDYQSAIGFAVLDFRNTRVWFSSADIKDNRYTLSLKEFDSLALNEIPMRYKLYLVFEEDDKIIFSRLYSESTKQNYKETQNKSVLYHPYISEKIYEGIRVHLIPNCTNSGYLGFILIKKSSTLNYLLTNTVKSFDVVDDRFCFDVQMQKIDNCSAFGITLMSKVNDGVYYNLEPDSMEENSEYFALHFNLSRKFFSLTQPDVLHMCSYYVIDGYKYLVAVRTQDKLLSENIEKLAVFDTTRTNTDVLEFTFHSPKNMLQFMTIMPNGGYKITDENTPQRILFSPEFIANKVAYATQIIDDGKYIIKLNMNTSKINDVCVFVHNEKTKEKIILDVKSFKRKKREIEVDFSAMRGNVEDFTSRTYAVCLGFSFNGYMYCVKLKSQEFEPEILDGKVIPRIDRFFEAVTSFAVRDTIVTIAPFYNKNGYFYIKLRDRLHEKLDLISVKFHSSSIHKNKLSITADVTDSDKHFTGFALSYVYHKSEDKRVYFVKADLVAKGNKTLLKAKLDLSKYELHRTRWNLFAVFIENDIPYFARIVVDNKEIKSLKFPWSSLINNNSYRVETEQGTDVFFPYYTVNKTQAFTMREECEYDTRRFKFKELFCLGVHSLLKGYYRKKRIIIIYEKFGKSAQDNGYQFFMHCMKHNVEKRLNAHIYYVIDKNSPDYKRVKKYDKHVLDFLSVKHIIYMIASRLLVSSDTRPHSYAWKANNSLVFKIIRGKKLFFLQHGVLGLKRVDNLMAKSKSEVFTKFVTSSEAEKNIVKKYMNYTDDEICVTGLARWDVLKDKSRNYNEILLMPTWRNWLLELEDEVFLKSDYYKTYTELINSERLKNILKENNLTLNFYMHPKFMNFVDKFDSDDRIHIVGEGTELNELIMRCKALITDYSSVCWDAFYMNKPVLFYQFDYDLYNKTHGSYIDMRKNLFGDRSITLDGLCDDIERTIKMDFRMPHKYERMREDSFAYFDDNNCSRIVQEIRKMKF